MMGERVKEEPMFYYVTIEKLVPQDHYLRLVDSTIDFTFIRPMVKHLYSHTGKPSIDPVVLIKMLLIGYLYNIPSERRLEQEIQVNLAYRWFLGCSLDEPIPDHSTISQTRKRRFKEDDTFQKIFDFIVDQCIQKGIVSGKCLATDSTHIKANASMKSLELDPLPSQWAPRVEREPSQYLKLLEANCDMKEIDNESSSQTQVAPNLHGAAELNSAHETPSLFLQTGVASEQSPVCNATHISKTDPDARLMTRPNKPKGLHYLNHITIDSLHTVITDVHVTAGNCNDHEPYIDRITRQKKQFGFDIEKVTADRAYGYAQIYHDLNQMDIDPYIPRQRYPGDKPIYPQNKFTYDAERDLYLCPKGESLHKKRYSKDRNSNIYQSNQKTCCLCPDRVQCTTSKKGVRTIHRHIYHEDIENALSNLKKPKAKEMAVFRKSVERIIAEAKGFHGMSRARLRGLSNVKEQCLMTAVVQNIKRLVAWTRKKASPANQLTAIKTKIANTVETLNYQLLNYPCFDFTAT